MGRLRNIGLLILLVATGATAAENTDSREHSVRLFAPNTNANTAATTQYRLPALRAADGLRKDRDVVTQKANASSINEAYFASVDVVLDGDFDGDGHYYVIDLEWDADTIFSAMDVYAVVWLSFEDGPWEEFITTDIYTLDGTSTLDFYRVETELQQGYPRGYYDVLLELYDPATGQLLAELGPVDSAALDELPLEDADRDSVFIHGDDGHGGSLGLYTMVALLGLSYYRRRRYGARRG
jgi:hypothetical protein